jgi:diguanylate cyclase (GGDEF)-like protein
MSAESLLGLLAHPALAALDTCPPEPFTVVLANALECLRVSFSRPLVLCRVEVLDADDHQHRVIAESRTVLGDLYRPLKDQVIPIEGDAGYLGLLTVCVQGTTGLSKTEQLFLYLLARKIGAALVRVDLAHKILLDPLTLAFNVRYFNMALDKEVRRSRSRGTPLGCIAIDLDGFWRANLEYGQQGGDAVLCEVATRVKQIAQPWGHGTSIARIGGDEFCVVLPGVAHPDVVGLAAVLTTAIGDKQFSCDDKDIPITASVGAAAFPEDGETAEALTTAADRAKLLARALGGNRFATMEDWHGLAPADRDALIEKYAHEKALIRGGQVTTNGVLHQGIVSLNWHGG